MRIGRQAYYAEYDGEKRDESGPCKNRCFWIFPLLNISSADRHLYLVGDLEICGLAGSQRSSTWPRPVSADLFLAVEIGRLAIRSKRKWRSGDSITAEPMYIRPPDALKKKTK